MEEFSLHSSIKSLSIVSIHPVSPNEVTYSFAHRTFTEFFAALYLTTLPQDQQLFYITRYNDKGLKHVVWQFFFGVMGEYYSKNITTLSTVLKRYFSVDHYSSMNSFCYQYCSAENRASITRTSLKAIRELGWAAKDYGQIYASTGIVMNSTVFAEGINPKYYSDVYFMHLLADFLEVATVHKLCYHGMLDFAIVIEDWTQKLNKTHLEFTIRSVKPVDPVVLPETSFVTFLSFKYSTFEFASQKFMQYVQHFFGNDWSTESIQMLKMFQILFRTQSLPNFTYVDLGISFNHSVNYTWLSSFTSIRALEFGAPLSSFQLSAVLRKPRELHSLQLHSLHCTDLPLVLDGLTELKHVFQISADAPMFL